MDSRSSSLSIKIALSLTLLLTACAPFRDSPFSDQLLTNARDLNAANEESLDIENKDHLRVAVLADPHQNYYELDKTIDQINNTKGIDFVVNLGDFTNQGYNLEYDRYIKSHERFRPPVFTVIGNHDALGAGRSLYKKAFGELNFVFETRFYRFVFFNSNNLETPKDFDPAWLEEQVTTTNKPVYIFTHVNLRDNDRFQDGDAEIFDRVLNHPNTKLILNGHNHKFYLHKKDDATASQVEVPRVEGKNWLLFEVAPTELKMQKTEGNSTKEYDL